MFLSDAVKLLSGDPTWHNLTALTYHYETQPLPTVFGWYAHQLPVWLHKVSTLIMFGIELALPFLIFTTRHLRFFAGFGFILLQFLIGITGNYNFFNILTFGLTLLLFDDQFWKNLLSTTITQKILTPSLEVPNLGNIGQIFS